MEISHLFHVHRFSIEARAPVMIASGDGDALFDNLLARDANGLPMIPATTLAGALRATLADADARRIFGFQGDGSGQRSTLSITDALAHWNDNRPRDGWHALPEPGNDKVVDLLVQESPVTRQHVRLNTFGVTHREGKFERSAVPAGTRFTFEISSWGDAADLDKIAAALSRGLSLGGAKRSGYGAFSCIGVGKQSFELTGTAEAARYRAYAKASLGDAAGFVMKPPKSNIDPGPGWTLEGQIEGTFLIGAPRSDGHGGRQPYAEISINWETATATIKPAEPTLPGSAIRGPLRHRTLFHLRRLKIETAQETVNALFGHAASGSDGCAGKLRFHDGEIIGGAQTTVAHVSLDRFTGGARDKSGALFSDHMLWRPKLRIRIDRLEPIAPEAARAFACALTDLKTGLLGIGAEWGEGAGVFESCAIAAPEEEEEGA